MSRGHAQQTLDHILAEATHEGTESLTDETEIELEQDVAADLELFIQLAKIGHYDRAMPFFDEYLKPYRFVFPVAAEYVDALLEQGAYAQAEEFLVSGHLLWETTSIMEVNVLALQSAIVKMHTWLDCEPAVLVADMVSAALDKRQAGALRNKEVCLDLAQKKSKSQTTPALMHDRYKQPSCVSTYGWNTLRCHVQSIRRGIESIALCNFSPKKSL